MVPLFLLSRPLDEECNLFRIEGFCLFKCPMGTSSNSLQCMRNLFPNDLLTNLFMIGTESGKILLIKKMAERSMSDIMEESGKTKKFLDIGEGRKFCMKELEKGGIKLFSKSPRNMHGSQGVLEPGMFGRGEHPAGTLQLEDTSKALNPRGVDHVPLCPFPFYPIRHHNVMINGVCDQSSPLSFFCPFHVPEAFFHDASSGRSPFFLVSGTNKLHLSSSHFPESSDNGPIISID
jgi:hypothetical protein